MGGLIIAAGVLGALLVVLLFGPDLRIGRNTRTAQQLIALYSMEATLKLAEIKKPGQKMTLEYLLLASGWGIQPNTFLLLCVAVGLVAGLFGWILLPGLPAIGLGVLVGFLPKMVLDDQANNRGKQIDKHLALAIERISALLLTGASLTESWKAVADALDTEGPNPLSPELRLTAMEFTTKTPEEALANLAERSPSQSLANLAALWGGISEAGGPAFAEAMSETAHTLQQILSARDRCESSASAVFNTCIMILVGLIIIIVGQSANPAARAAILNPLMQIFMVIMFAIMGVGFFYMRKMKQEAV